MLNRSLLAKYLRAERRKNPQQFVGCAGTAKRHNDAARAAARGRMRVEAADRR